MSKVNTSRRKFLVDASAATCGAGLAVAGVDPSASRSARDTLRIEEWRPDGRYEPGSLVRTLHGDVLIGDFEEVLSIPGRYLNDHCLVRNRDEWHFFGITGLIPPSLADDSRRAESEISFAHATSSDLKKWKLWPDVIQCSGAWPEVSHVLAPYVVERQGTYYMLYAATDKDTTQRICLATSHDLFHWDRYSGNPVIVPSLSWSRWPGFGIDVPDGQSTYGGCRDPCIIQLPDGRYVAYWASRLQTKFGEDLCCIAASLSTDLIHWQEVGPVLSVKAWFQSLTLEAESPCVVFKDGSYWIFFKHGWWTHVAQSNSPFDFLGSPPIPLGFSHASKVLFWQEDWWITHCKTFPDDFSQQRSNRLKGLYLGRLEWPKGGYPRFAERLSSSHK
jgi:beta-1,4-mannooligosaccharide phosphorylase